MLFRSIARNLYTMAQLRTPVVSVVIGEGGSGGALAIGVCDRLLMLQYATYSVISPEGCASILWKSAEKADVAAEAMGITASQLKRLGFVDQILPEPLGGAHRDVNATADTLAQALATTLDELTATSVESLVAKRTARLMQYGKFEES